MCWRRPRSAACVSSWCSQTTLQTTQEAPCSTSRKRGCCMHACKRRRRRRRGRGRGHFQSVAFMACRVPLAWHNRQASPQHESSIPPHLTSPRVVPCPALPCLQVCGCGHHLRRGGPQLRGCQVPVLYQSPGHAGEDGSCRVESGRGEKEEIEALGLGTGGKAAVISRSEG